MSVKHVILVLLQKKPAGAYSLKQSIDELTGNAWPMNIGQVSQTITRLDRAGLVQSAGEVTTGGRVAELYAITEAGEEELSRWWRTPLVKSPRDRDDLVMRVLAAVHSDAVDVSDIIQTQRKQTLQALAEATRELRKGDSADVASYFILQRRIFDLDSESRWLDHIERIARAASIERKSDD